MPQKDADVVIPAEVPNNEDLRATTSLEMFNAYENALVGLNNVVEEKYEKFVANVRLKLGDVSLCRIEDGLYVSLMNAVSLKEFIHRRSWLSSFGGGGRQRIFARKNPQYKTNTNVFLFNIFSLFSVRMNRLYCNK